jgi:hypothetical protein
VWGVYGQAQMERWDELTMRRAELGVCVRYGAGTRVPVCVFAGADVEVPLALVKELRAMSGAPIMDCKKALAVSDVMAYGGHVIDMIAL